MTSPDELWRLWERLQVIRNIVDDKGNIPCYLCGKLIAYTKMTLMIVHRRSFPFLFLTENNYFCCGECMELKDRNKIAKEKRNQELGYSLTGKITKHSKVTWDDHDIERTARKIRRILKNHNHE